MFFGKAFILIRVLHSFKSVWLQFITNNNFSSSCGCNSLDKVVMWDDNTGKTGFTSTAAVWPPAHLDVLGVCFASSHKPVFLVSSTCWVTSNRLTGFIWKSPVTQSELWLHVVTGNIIIGTIYFTVFWSLSYIFIMLNIVTATYTTFTCIAFAQLLLCCLYFWAVYFICVWILSQLFHTGSHSALYHVFILLS